MDSYYTLATEFCSWLKELNLINENNATVLLAKLMAIYIASTELSYPEDITDRVTPYKSEKLMLSCDRDLYWEIYDPFVLEEAVCGSVIDDLTDIYNDILQGTYLYECGLIDEAAWFWKWNFENHWKYHATDAMRALCRFE